MNTTTLREQEGEERIDLHDGRQASRAKVVGKVVYAILGLFLVIALVAAAGLGVWSYRLNTGLSASQHQLASLQADYGKLQADHAKATADLTQANAALDQTRSDLAKAKADLESANRTITAQHAQMELAGSLIGILEAIFVNGESTDEVEAKIISTGDAKFIGLWNTMMRTPNEENLLAFYQYLFGRISLALK